MLGFPSPLQQLLKAQSKCQNLHSTQFYYPIDRQGHSRHDIRKNNLGGALPSSESLIEFTRAAEAVEQVQTAVEIRDLGAMALQEARSI